MKNENVKILWLPIETHKMIKVESSKENKLMTVFVTELINSYIDSKNKETK